MKSLFKNIAEKLAKFVVVKGITQLLICMGEWFEKVWGFFRVRAILPLPSGSSCHRNVYVKFRNNVRIAGPIMISPDCVFGAKAMIEIGSHVRLSQGVHIETASLDLNSGLPYRHIAKPVKIGDGVWLGSHVMVLGGVTIGDNAVIGAGVVVSRDVPDGAVVVGMGTRNIKRKESYLT